MLAYPVALVPFLLCLVYLLLIFIGMVARDEGTALKYHEKINAYKMKKEEKQPVNEDPEDTAIYYD